MDPLPRGVLYTNTLLDHALIARMPVKPGAAAMDNLHRLLADCVISITTVRRLLTIMELPGCSSSLILDPDIYENFVHSLRARWPLNAYQGDAVSSTVSSLLDVKLIGTPQKLPEHMIVGRVFPRNDPSSEQPVVTTITGLATQGGDNLEMLTFPYLFPQGSGAYSGMKCIHKYAQYRAQQAFSLFTLLPQEAQICFVSLKALHKTAECIVIFIGTHGQADSAWRIAERPLIFFSMSCSE
jgi:hypothetical protein